MATEAEGMDSLSLPEVLESLASSFWLSKTKLRCCKVNSMPINKDLKRLYR